MEISRLALEFLKANSFAACLKQKIRLNKNQVIAFSHSWASRQCDKRIFLLRVSVLIANCVVKSDVYQTVIAGQVKIFLCLSKLLWKQTAKTTLINSKNSKLTGSVIVKRKTAFDAMPWLRTRFGLSRQWYRKVKTKLVTLWGFNCPQGSQSFFWFFSTFT